MNNCSSDYGYLMAISFCKDNRFTIEKSKFSGKNIIKV